MKNTIKLDHENRRIVMDKTFAKLSADVRNEEYDILQRVRRDYPTYEVANRKIKKNPSKQSYRGLTYENMRNYVKDHSGAVSFEYKCLEEMIRASERNDMHYAIVKPREERNSERLYAKIHLDALREAMKTLNGSGLKLWLFLNKNQDNFTVNITPSSCQRWGIKKDSYYSGINELIEKNYLVKVYEHDSVYYFYETSIPDSEKPKWFSEDNSTNITANKNGIKEEK